jgi:hypothetical protein
MEPRMSNPRPFKLLRQLGEQTIGREARSQSGDHSAVKLWLRLLVVQHADRTRNPHPAAPTFCDHAAAL